MKLIYTAGPYTGKTYSEVDDNIKKAENVSIQLWKKGWAVICPHLNTCHFEIYEGVAGIDYHTWIKGDLLMLEKCDAIIMCQGWENSKGSIGELELAKKLGIEIFYEKNGIPELKS